MRWRIVWILAIGSAFAINEVRADEPARIVLIGKDRDHPYKSHEYMTGCRLLAKCLMQTPGIETHISNGWPKDEIAFRNVKAIVMYTASGGDVLFGRSHRVKAEQLLKGGVGLVAIHWATAAEPPVGEKYLNVLGGWFHSSFSKYPVRQSVLHQVDSSHPISFGWNSFAMRDEYYVDLKYVPTAKPLWTANFDGKDNVVAWTFDRPDGGRSFATVCGHFWDNFADERFRRGLVNGILWAARRDIPKEGARVQVVDKDLEVPPPVEPKK